MSGVDPEVAMLFDNLSAEQVGLLRLVWECIPMASNRGVEPDWPVWDYVRRSLYREFRGIDDAESVLESLPSVRRPWDFYGRPYGLVWHTGAALPTPVRENRVGLTVAGLAVLARHGLNTAEIADAFVGIIAQAAKRDDEQTPNPFEPVQTEFALDSHLALLEQPTRGRPFVFPGRLVVEGLDRGREYPRLQVGGVEGRHWIELGWVSLRGFRGIGSATEYLALIESMEAAQEPPTRYTSPLGLSETLDYLGYVLAADPRFKWERLTTAPNLQSAAALATGVKDRFQYDSALSALWNVIDQLHVPEVPLEVAQSQFHGSQPRSLQRLRYWIEDRLDDEAAAQRVAQAIAVVQKVGRLRVAPQHASETTTSEAIKIRRAFGLPDYVSDYGAAWDAIRDTVAGAFNVVREEVQRAV